MNELDVALSKVDGPHKEALNWFEEFRGKRVKWRDILEHAELGARLVNSAKGIYKPAYTDFALSVRVIQEGPYPDKEVEHRPNGSWVCQYYQENIDPTQRDKEATNRGLMRCMEEQIPIGFLIKRKPKPGVEYEVLGLGFVKAWKDGYFTIEGINLKGETTDDIDAARARASQPLIPDPDDIFDTKDDTDLRQKQIVTVAVRRGQSSFRSGLLAAYNGNCCITGCDLVAALEAAHILPYRGKNSNHVQNGLLLRSDIHTLFDLGLIAIDKNNSVILAPSVFSSATYKDLNGIKLAETAHPRLSPSKEALRKHRDWTGL
jgi:putative restriction endonuclease